MLKKHCMSFSLSNFQYLVTLYAANLMNVSVKKIYGEFDVHFRTLAPNVRFSIPLNFPCTSIFWYEIYFECCPWKNSQQFYMSHIPTERNNKNKNMLCKTHSLWPVVFLSIKLVVVIWYNVSKSCFAMKDIYM